MKMQLDLSKEYGIVLEGGGAKGAYQVGAWKALREAGLKIKALPEPRWAPSTAPDLYG